MSNKVLVSQPQPAIIEKSPFYEVAKQHKLELEFAPLNKVVGVTPKEFRSQRVNILDHTAVVFTSRSMIDSFFVQCESNRVVVPESMKYICSTEAIALYLQKYIQFRKRKISFADGTIKGLLEIIVKHKDEKIFLSLSEPHKPELPEALKAMQLNFTPVILTRTVPNDAITAENISSCDMLLLYSPWDVKAISALAEKIEKMPNIATFGDGTLKVALENNLPVVTSAPTPAAPSLAKAVDNYYTAIQKGEKVEVILKEDNTTEEFVRTQAAKIARKPRKEEREKKSAKSTKATSTTKKNTKKTTKVTAKTPTKVVKK